MIQQLSLDFFKDPNFGLRDSSAIETVIIGEVAKAMENPIKKIGNATIYNSDCMEAFRLLKNNSVDFIATDPPYFLDGMDNNWSDKSLKNKVSKAGTIGGLPVGMKFDPEQGIRLEKFFNQVSVEASRVLKPGGFLVSFSQGRLFHRIAIAAENAGFEIRDMLAWEHSGGQGKAFTQNHFVNKMKIDPDRKRSIIEEMGNRKTPQLRPKFEAILLAQKPKDGTFVDNWMKWKTGLIKTDFDDQPTTIFNYKKTTGARKTIDHMTIKPVDLMSRLIEIFSVPGQIVLDPFMGSGTTGVAALGIGRKFIGFEIEKKYFEASAERLKSHEKNR
ncbi:MAG: site-specific DNA-methyltransferase [bacterium]|nr:site-specific DNA-methyltransferase [bacterium]